MIKKINFRILFVLATVLAFSSNVFADFAGGTGSKSDPFLVANAEQLATIRTTPTDGAFKWVALLADIDFDGMAAQASFNNSGGKLQMNIEGNGFVIKNLTIEGKGFCGQLDGIIQNVGFENITVTSTANFGAAVIAGHSWGGKVYNCYVKTATVTAPLTGTDGQATGIIIGAAMGNPTKCIVKDCYTEDVTVTGRIGSGALIGRMHCGAFNCATFGGTISAEVNMDQGDGKGVGYAGPVAGDTWKESTYDVSNVYFAADAFTYKIAGKDTAGYLEKMNDGTTDIATAVAAADVKTEAAYVGFDFDNVWTMGTEHPELTVFSTAKINIMLPDTVQADTATYQVPFMAFRTEATDVFCYQVGDAAEVVFTPENAMMGSVMVKDLAIGMNDVTVSIKRNDAVVASATTKINATYEISAINDAKAIEVAVYPNPSTGIFNLTLDNASDITVRNLAGQAVYTQAGVAGANQVDMTSFSAGTYLMTIQNADEAGTVVLQVK